MRPAIAVASIGIVLGLLSPPALGAAGEEGMPQLKAPSAILVEGGQGRVLVAKNADERRAPASMTKLMTLLLLVRAIRSGKAHWNDLVPVSEAAYRTGGSQIWLEPGERLTRRELAIAIADGSANDACVAVAEHLAGTSSQFAALMNREARRLGMRATHFANPHGLDEPGHYTTARDMAVLGLEAVRYPELLALTSRREDRSLRDGKGGTLWLVNPNRLLGSFPGLDGLKTGYTAKAGYCLVASALRDHLRLIAVVMGDPTAKDRNADAAELLAYGFNRYQAVPVARPGEAFGPVPVRVGAAAAVPAVPERALYLTVERGREEGLRRRVQLTPHVVAPVRRGQVLGEVVLEQGGHRLAAVRLVAARSVARLSLFGRLARLFRGALGGAAG